VETNQQDLGIVLLQKQKALSAEVADLKLEAAAALKDADSAKAALVQVQAEIKKLKAEKDSMLAKMQSAQVKVRIQEQLEGLSVVNEIQSLEKFSGHIVY